MKINMVPSNYKTIDEFADTLLKNKKVFKRYRHLSFIILDNEKIPWSWYKEKMFQLLYWNMQGGITGASRGHPLYFEKDLHEGLKKAKDKGHTHAMVCKIGMILSGLNCDQKTVKTPIQNFYEFTESDQFMRAHILARPKEKNVTIHTQHLEINLEKWKGEELVKLGNSYIRSYKNIHDDYTPLWIDIPFLPRIYNFNEEQRLQKRFTYPHKDYANQEKIVYDFLKNNKKYKVNNRGRFYYRSNSFQELSDDLTSSKIIIDYLQQWFVSSYYFVNNEQLPFRLTNKYDLIVCSAAGIFAEYLLYFAGHENTKVIIYNYKNYFLKLKQKIIDIGLVGDDLIKFAKKESDVIGNVVFPSIASLPNNNHAVKYNENLITNEKILELQNNLLEHDCEYIETDLLTTDFTWLENNIKDKKVLFHASNIFMFGAVWASHDYHVIENQYKKLAETLKKSKSFKFIGRRPRGVRK